MRRRDVLSCLAISATAVGGGCLQTIGSPGETHAGPETPRGLTIETSYRQQNVIALDYSGRQTEHFDAYEEQRTIVRTNAAAEAAFTDPTHSSPFVRETRFAESDVLIAQTGMQSGVELTLRSADRSGEGIAVEIDVVGPEIPGDDLTTHSLLIRITDDVLDDPRPATVSIDGYR